MPAYLVVEISYDDKGWTEAYRRDVPGLMDRIGAHYLAKTLTVERIEGHGPDPDTVAVVEFPSAEAARAFLASPEYRPYAEARRAGSRSRMYLLEGVVQS